MCGLQDTHKKVKLIHLGKVLRQPCCNSSCMNLAAIWRDCLSLLLCQSPLWYETSKSNYETSKSNYWHPHHLSSLPSFLIFNPPILLKMLPTSCSLPLPLPTTQPNLYYAASSKNPWVSSCLHLQSKPANKQNT